MLPSWPALTPRQQAGLPPLILHVAQHARRLHASSPPLRRTCAGLLGGSEATLAARQQHLVLKDGGLYS